MPPEPSLSDPYPGYYQLPSGQWQAHDPEYYNSFFASGDGKGDAGKSEDDGRIGRHWDDFNTKGANFVDVDVGEGLKRGREERERLEMTKKPKLPSDEFEYKVGHHIPSAEVRFANAVSSSLLDRSKDWQHNDINCPPCSTMRTRRNQR